MAHVVFVVKRNENTNPKGRLLMQMYRVVPITKRGNLQLAKVYVIYSQLYLKWLSLSNANWMHLVNEPLSFWPHTLF